jgi:hypothetical protein
MRFESRGDQNEKQILKMPFAIEKMYFLYCSFLSGHLALQMICKAREGAPITF